MFKHIFLVLIALTLPLQGMSSDLHLRLPEVSYGVLAQKDNAYGLEEILEITSGDQVDLQIAYENLLQAQKKITLARAQYFPYGLGTVGILYYLNSFNPLILVELVTSLPAKIYNVQKEKNLRMATVYSNKALALNIRNQVENLYYTVLKEESSLQLAELELYLLETIYSSMEERVTLGLESSLELRNLELRILDIRDIVLKFQAYLVEEKSAFNILLGKDPTESLELQPRATFLSSLDFGKHVEDLRQEALARSPEITAANYVVTAAYRNRSSLKWSVLSFSGIGFGYWANINVAGSQIDAALYNRKLVQNNIENQVYVLNTDFHRNLDFFENEKSVFNDTAIFYEAELARFNSSEIPLSRLAESGILYVKDFAEMVVAHYNALIKLSELERGVNGKVQGNAEEKNLVDVEFTELNSERFSLSVKSSEDILSVEYVFDKIGWVPVTVKNTATSFRVVYANSAKDALAGHVNVTFKNGEVITKKFNFNK